MIAYPSRRTGSPSYRPLVRRFRFWSSLTVVLGVMYGPDAFADCAAPELEVSPTVARAGQQVQLSGYGICDDTGEACERHPDGPKRDVRLTVDGKDYTIGTARSRYNGKGDKVRLPEGVTGKGAITLVYDARPGLTVPITITP